MASNINCFLEQIPCTCTVFFNWGGWHHRQMHLQELKISVFSSFSKFSSFSSFYSSSLRLLLFFSSYSSLPLPPLLVVLCFFQFPISSCSWSVSSFTLSLFTTLWYCIEHQKVMVSPNMLCKDGAMQPKVCPPVLSTPYLPSPSWLFRLFRYGPSRVRFGMVWFFFVSSVILISFGTTSPIVSEHGTPMLLVCSSLFWGVLVGACTFHLVYCLYCMLRDVPS